MRTARGRITNPLMMKQIPNLFTLLNLFFGCCAVVFVMQHGIALAYTEEGAQFISMPEEIWWASAFIGLAGVVDFLDGFVARAMKASSEMGKQLDSLADVVSFGVAPSLIIYHFLRVCYSADVEALNTSWWLLSPAFLFACAAAYRLAKFNIATDQQYGFKGVPTPAAGLLVASLPLIFAQGIDSITVLFYNKWFWYGLIVVMCWLMVSNLPLMALKFKDFSVKNNLPKIILLLAAVVCGIFLQWLAVPVVFVLYIVLSLAFKNKTT